MPREIIVAARHIATEVRQSEDGFDLALANNARLIASLLDLRREAKLPARTGRDALNRALEAISHGAKAREVLLDMHEELAGLNLRELASGDMLECPDGWVAQQSGILPSGKDAAAA